MVLNSDLVLLGSFFGHTVCNFRHHALLESDHEIPARIKQPWPYHTILVVTKLLEHAIDSPRLCYCKRTWSLRRKKIVDTLHRDKLVLFPLRMLSFWLSHRFGDVCQGFTLTMCCSWIRMTLCVKQWLSDHHPTMGSNARFQIPR